jgi:hypothetical protein
MILKAAQANAAPLDKVRKIVEVLPETPYTALGLNIMWTLKMEGPEDLGEFTWRNFAVPHHPLYESFHSPDARFGTYLSSNFSGFRMKLEIKPVTIENVTLPTKAVSLNFNFHLDIGNVADKATIIKANLMKWTEAFSEAERVAQIFV